MNGEVRDEAFKFQAFCWVKEGVWRSSAPPYSEIPALLDTLLANAGYVVRPGISNYVRGNFGEHGFESKNPSVWSSPLHWYDSQQCLIWYKLSNTSSAQKKPDSPGYHVSGSCRSPFTRSDWRQFHWTRNKSVLNQHQTGLLSTSLHTDRLQGWKKCCRQKTPQQIS